MELYGNGDAKRFVRPHDVFATSTGCGENRTSTETVGCLAKQMRRRSQTNTTGASRANVDSGAATRPDDVR
ncbi:unnamed protein product, partial [Iphiclides podalirius]